MGARGRLTLGRGAPECRPARTEREAPPSASAAATAHPPSPPPPQLSVLLRSPPLALQESRQLLVAEVGGD